MLGIAIQRLPHGADLDLPAYQSAGASGLDLCAALSDELILDPGARALVPTGVAIALPDGYEAQIRPRSGLAARHGVTVLNAPGTVDADYRGELKVLLINLGQAPFAIRRGLRVAQLVIAPVARISWSECATLPASVRDVGGFGSTGVDSTGRLA